MSDSRISVREDEEIFRQRRRVVEALYRLADNDNIVGYNLDRWRCGGFPNLEAMLVDTVEQLLSVNKNLTSQLITQINCSTNPILLKAHGDSSCIGPGCPYCDEEESKSQLTVS